MNTADPMIVERFRNLPQKLKDVLFSEDTTDIIFAIGKEAGLTVPQMEELSDEIGLVVLEINTPENFSTNIEKALSINTERARPVARAVSEKIFNPILGDIKAFVRPPISLEIPATKNEARPTKIEKSASPEAKRVDPIKTIEAQKPAAPTVAIAAPPPVAPRPTNPGVDQSKKNEASVFAKPIKDPYREPLDTKEPVSLPSPTKVSERNLSEQTTKPRVVSWEDILKNKSKEPETHPGAKTALEKAMNDPVAAPIVTQKNAAEAQLPKENIPKYTGGKDPYHEPIE